MSRYVSGCGSLYRYNDLSVSSFVNHMYDIDKYLHPSAIGVFSLGYFEKGFEDFARSRGVNIQSYWSDNGVTKDTFAEYIKAGLRIDSPVVYLQYFNSNQKEYD